MTPKKKNTDNTVSVSNEKSNEKDGELTPPVSDQSDDSTADKKSSQESKDEEHLKVNSLPKSTWKASVLGLTQVIVMAYVFILILDGVGIFLCDKNELCLAVNIRLQWPTQEAVEYGHDLNTNVDQNKKKKAIFGFLNPNKHNQKRETIDRKDKQTDIDSCPDLCMSIGSTLKTLTSFVPLPLFSKITKQTNFPSGTALPKPRKSLHKQKHRKHVLKRMVDGAATFFQKFKKNKPNAGKGKTHDKQMGKSHYHKFSDAQIKCAEELSLMFKEKVNEAGANFYDRMDAVAWGGPGPESRPWMGGKKKGGKGKDCYGVPLMLSYLKIMNFPKDKITKFPFDLCKQGCATDFALVHTLEWREKYKPWLMTPAAIEENKAGWIYAHGYSPSFEDEPGPSIVFLRPGLHAMKNPEGYLRTLINTLEFAVVDGFTRSGDRFGKYNVLLDSTDFKISNIGSIHNVKRAFRMMKDHFPDRLSHIFFTNLGGPAQLFLKLVTPFIEDSVKEKMHVIPNDPKTRVEMLRPLLGEQFIPTWLGGEDTFEFNAQEYYGRSKSLVTTNEDGLSYLTTMPYHA